jgi:hypothetical protein
MFSITILLRRLKTFYKTRAYSKGYNQKGTIKSRLLVAFILLVLLPTSAVTLTNAILDFSNGKELIKNQLFSVATIKASQVNDWVDLLERDLRIILAIVHLKEIF